jgi:hypothetical protein
VGRGSRKTLDFVQGINLSRCHVAMLGRTACRAVPLICHSLRFGSTEQPRLRAGYHASRLGAVFSLILIYGVELRPTLVTPLDLSGASPHQRNPPQLPLAACINC